MQHSVTALYAAALAAGFIFLSVRVIARRRASGIAIGTQGDKALERAARVHANFAEYVPMALLMLWFVEQAGYPAWIVHALGLVLVFARTVHAIGYSRVNEDFRFRVVGMMGTFSVLAFAVVLVILRP